MSGGRTLPGNRPTLRSYTCRVIAVSRTAALEWLLAETGCPYQPSVTYVALTTLLDCPPTDPAVVAAREAIAGSPFVVGLLAAMQPDGTFMPGEHGWVPIYNGAPWRLMLLGELRAPGDDERIRTAVERSLAIQVRDGSFPYSGASMKGSVLCYDAHLLRALLQLGYGSDPRVQAAIGAVARLTLGWTCRFNDRLPCAWGDEKALGAFAELSPAERAASDVQEAIAEAAARLLARDLAVADYPYNRRVSPQWFRFTLRRDFRGDILETLLALAGCGFAGDPRLPAARFVAAKATPAGRWRLEAAIRGVMPPFDAVGAESKWITLQALRVLRAWSLDVP